FSALLNYRHMAQTRMTAQYEAAWQGIETFNAKDNTNYPLPLNVDDTGDGFRLSVLITADIGAQRLCDYMQAALEQLVQALEQTPAAPMNSLTILPAAERQKVLVDFNATATDSPRQMTVHALFEAQAERTPEATAVAHDATTLSYHELNLQANRLAAKLLELGVQPGHSVALLLPRSIDLVLSQLAVLKCAAIYVPLDINAPQERQTFMVQDSQAVLVLTYSTETLDPGTQRLDLDTRPASTVPADSPNPVACADSVAYIMYTSGSTGTPKGVLVPHRAICRLVIDNGYADFNGQDRVAFASNPAFDASTLDVWAPLLNGGCVIVVEQSVLLSQEAFRALLLAQSVSVLWLTAGLFHQYADGLMEVFAGL
ncbi:AMP-binding protein, partial [Pseudomonas syringae]